MHPEAKTAILRRVRAGVNRQTELADAQTAWAGITRDYERGSSARQETLLTLLEDRLRDYDVVVERVTRATCAGAVARVLGAQANVHALMPPGIAPNLLPADHCITLDDAFSKRELDGFGAVVTQATLAIAETGTLVLQGVPGQGRRAANLVPDFHLCFVDAATVVATVPEAIARLQATAHLPTTFVSGPSATADIEMTRIKGVHGPRFLHILLIEQDGTQEAP